MVDQVMHLSNILSNIHLSNILSNMHMSNILYNIHLSNILLTQVYCIYNIRPNKRTVYLQKNWAMEKCQGICFYNCTPKFVSLDNKVTALH